MERKYVLPFVLALAGACNNQAKVKQPEPVYMNVARTIHESSNNNNSPQGIHSLQRIAPIGHVTEEIRAGFERICGVIEPHKSCVREELRVFFTMTKKVPPHVNRGCMPDGEYEPQCIEDAYKLQFGEDQMYNRLKRLDLECPEKIKECTEDKLRRCKDSYADCLDREKRKIYGPVKDDPHKHNHP